jgi:uncharacterized protein YqfB (UPF0267 family)
MSIIEDIRKRIRERILGEEETCPCIIKVREMPEVDLTGYVRIDERPETIDLSEVKRIEYIGYQKSDCEYVIEVRYYKKKDNILTPFHSVYFVIWAKKP